MQPFTGIIIYRSLIALSGALCIYLGYRLFYIVTETQGRLSVSTGHDQALQLQDVAPGVFFALFGAVILVVSLFRPVTYEDGDAGKSDDGGKTDGGKTDGGTAIAAENGGRAAPRVKLMGK